MGSLIDRGLLRTTTILLNSGNLLSISKEHLKLVLVYIFLWRLLRLVLEGLVNVVVAVDVAVSVELLLHLVLVVHSGGVILLVALEGAGQVVLARDGRLRVVQVLVVPRDAVYLRVPPLDYRDLVVGREVLDLLLRFQVDSAIR